MKRTKLILAVMAAVFVVMAAGFDVSAQEEREALGLRLPHLRVDAPVRVLPGSGDSLKATISLHNPYDKPVRLLPEGGIWNDLGQVAPYFEMRMMDVDTRRVIKSVAGQPYKPMGGYTYLATGEQAQFELDLIDWGGIGGKPGIYSFSIRYRIDGSVADSNVFIFEIPGSARRRLIDTREKMVEDFLRIKKAAAVEGFVSPGGLWVETGGGSMALYTQPFWPDLIDLLDLPVKEKKIKPVGYLPAYDAVFWKSGEDGSGLLFYFADQDGQPRINRIVQRDKESMS